MVSFLWFKTFLFNSQKWKWKLLSRFFAAAAFAAVDHCFWPAQTQKWLEWNPLFLSHPEICESVIDQVLAGRAYVLNVS